MEHTEYVDLGRFETYIHYHFKDKHLLLEALSHSSYANEKHKTRNSNERLEFLGDSVLSIVVSEFLFHKYPDLPEGELTKLRASMVCEKALHVFAREIHLGEFLLLARVRSTPADVPVRRFWQTRLKLSLRRSFWTAAWTRQSGISCVLFRRIRLQKDSSLPASTTIRHGYRKSCRRIRRKRWSICLSANAVPIMTRRSK